MKRSSGFTLIELSIVLVIIGLLLGGVLKGQELIASAKVKNMAGDFKSIQVMLYGYQDKFRALPGDDAGVVSHVSGGTLAQTGTPGNAVIEGDWDSIDSKDESFLFWQHVRLAGLAAGSADLAAPEYLPRNADGGRLGVQSIGAFRTAGITDASLTGLYVACSDGVAGKLAKQLDVTLDDGATASGAVRVIKQAGMPGPSLTTDKVADNDLFTVCMTF